MPRAYTNSDFANLVNDPGAGDLQALRGELLALLDKVESHYVPPEPEPAVSTLQGLARRVQNLHDQVSRPEPVSRREEALRSVQRTVERFNERETQSNALFDDDLTAAIAEIRHRQGPTTAAPQARRAPEFPELRELGSLVGGMSQRLERLESELKSQRHNGAQVNEVASQVEQLTQVVELIAGAVGETGQVKRLEAQIAALGVMIERGPRADMSVLSRRMDDVSVTVGKLAELQAEQMERELIREERRAVEAQSTLGAESLLPSMHAIEQSVRNVYDRIDTIERNVALSSTDFDRLTSEMASFTSALQTGAGSPQVLVERVELLAQRLEAVDTSNGEVEALKVEIVGLRNAVLSGLEPRFSRIEDQIDALNSRITPVDTSAVETQLRALMDRMDEASAQIDALSRAYEQQDVSIDYTSLADMVAERTSQAIAKAGPAATAAQDANLSALEKRMTALLNTAGKETAERLARLEVTLSNRQFAPAVAPAPAPAPAPVAFVKTPAPSARDFDADDAFEQAVSDKANATSSKLEAILTSLGATKNDAMPINPAEDAPLVDQSLKLAEVPQKRMTQSRMRAETVAAEAPKFDPSTVTPPPRPQSSLASDPKPAFADETRASVAKELEAAPSVSSTSTFVAAARRAQRARQDETPEDADSIIGKALAFVLPRRDAELPDRVVPPTVIDTAPPAPAAPKRAIFRARLKDKTEDAPVALDEAESADETVTHQNVLRRYRRPILLATALTAVSLLAINLVLQRAEPTSVAQTPAPAVAAPENAAPVTVLTDPTPAAGLSDTLTAPNMREMIDPTSTGSINPGAPMSFSRPSVLPDITMPPPLAEAPVSTAAPDPILTAALNPAETVRDAFALPAEGVGPLELRQAAASGNAQAQYEVAAIYGEGRGVPTNAAEAIKWYERSAAQGFVPAQYRLGNLYEMGTGVEKSFEQAKLWYQRAADGGHRMAMHNLAALYAGGHMGGQQFELAAEWFERAANRGMVDSQFNLGMLYARGLGVEQNFEQSYKYFSLAALSGDKDAGLAKTDIVRSLSADAVQRVDAELLTWKPAPLVLAANFAPIGTWSTAFEVGDAITAEETVKRVQVALTKLGFDVGTPDGKSGPQTVEAIRAFERATGMSESGEVNPRLLAVLGSQPV